MKKEYTKPFLTYQKQIDLLKSRKMTFSAEEEQKSFK